LQERGVKRINAPGKLQAILKKKWPQQVAKHPTSAGKTRKEKKACELAACKGDVETPEVLAKMPATARCPINPKFYGAGENHDPVVVWGNHWVLPVGVKKQTAKKGSGGRGR